MRKRIEVLIETERLLITSQRRSLLVWCERCSAQARMITVDEAAALAQLSARAVYRLVEAGELHYAETPEGRLWICLNSIR